MGSLSSHTFVKCISDFSSKHTFLCGGGQVIWADRFCLFLGGKSNDSETCGLGLDLDLHALALFFV